MLFSVISLVLVSSEKIYTLLNTVLHNSKHLEVRQKYLATRRIFQLFSPCLETC